MSKASRKPRPTMPKWFWLYDVCPRCKARNNCNQCKAARRESKAHIKSRHDARQLLREGELQT